jgi:hemerythrin-like metal-binding protein
VDTKSIRKLQETPVSFKTLAVDPIDDLTGKNLPAGLDTGNPELDFGHAQLLACIASLRKLCAYPTNSTCNTCSGTQRGRCESSLIGLLGDLLIFILDHFQAEEKAMRDSLLYMVDRHVCEAHMEDHAQISHKIQEIVSAIDPSKTVVLVRELDQLLERWVTHHTVLHDQALERWMMRQEFKSLNKIA